MTKFLLIDALADQQNVGAPALNHSLLGTTFGGLIAEGIGTFLLVWTVVAVAGQPTRRRATGQASRSAACSASRS